MIPEELIPSLAAWVEEQGYHMVGTGLRNCTLVDIEPTLFVFKKNNNSPPPMFDMSPMEDQDECTKVFLTSVNEDEDVW